MHNCILARTILELVRVTYGVPPVTDLFTFHPIKPFSTQTKTSTRIYAYSLLIISYHTFKETIIIFFGSSLYINNGVFQRRSF